MSGLYCLDPWLEGYLSYLAEVRRSSAGTVRDVRCTLRQVCRFMEGHCEGVPLWKLSLKDYVAWIESERGRKRSSHSLSKRLSHLRGMLDYAWRSGKADRNVLDGFTIHDEARQEVPEFLTVEEARRLVEACPMSDRTERAERVMVLLLYGCGLRTFELCALNVQDVHRDRRELFVAQGKGGRQRYVPIPEGVYSELLAYLCQRGGRRGPLFRTMAKQARIRPKYLSQVVRRAAERAGLTKVVTPKVLRHSYATHLMDRGVDLAVIAQLMGHRSPTETGIYLHVLPQRPREATDRLRFPSSKKEN